MNSGFYLLNWDYKYTVPHPIFVVLSYARQTPYQLSYIPSPQISILKLKNLIPSGGGTQL